MPSTNDHASNIDDDQRGRIIGVMVSLILLTIITVASRLVSRKLARAGFWWDDLLCVIALIVTLMCPAIMLWELRNGFGRHIYYYGDQTTQIEITAAWLKGFWFFQWIFHTATTIAKFSVLAFYYRIFPIRWFRRLLLWVAALCLVHIVVVDLAIIFQCHPVHHSWDQVRPGAEGECFHQIDFFIGSGSANAVLNFLLFILPIPILRRLRTTPKQRLVLAALFTLAGFVVLVSIIWIIVISRLYLEDVTWNFINMAIWSVLEPSMAVICACIPSLRPLASIIDRSFSSLPSSHTVIARITNGSTNMHLTTTSSKQRAWASSVKQSYGDESMEDESHDLRPLGHEVRIGQGKGEGGEVPPPRFGINVKTEVVLDSEMRLDYYDRLF